MKGPLISQHSGRLTPLKSGSAGPDGEAVEKRVRVGWVERGWRTVNSNRENYLNGLLDNSLLVAETTHFFFFFFLMEGYAQVSTQRSSENWQ